MSRVIVSSSVFLRELKRMRYEPAHAVRIIGNAETHKLSFGGRCIDCEIKLMGFDLPLYYTAVNRVIKLLEFVEEQPIVVEFRDSEQFNITLHGVIV